MRGDRFVARDETAQRTLGGGTIIHPWSTRHKRGEANLLERLKALHTGDFAQLMESFLNESSDFALAIDAIHQFLNLRGTRRAAKSRRFEVPARAQRRGRKSLHD